MFRFESLEIWKLAINYGNALYELFFKFPKEERFALADQLRRAAVSISNNIAEGSGGTNKEFKNYLSMAIRSTLETVNILYFARKQKYISDPLREEFYEKAEEIIRKTRAFKNSLGDKQ